MKSKLIKLCSLFTIAVMMGVAAANAQDKALRSALVKKGYLTQQEATEIAKETVVVVPSEESTRLLSVNGLVQTQYDYVAVRDDAAEREPKATNRFLMRRVDLGATAHLGNGWSGVLNCRVFGQGMDSGNARLKEAYIQKDIEWNLLGTDTFDGSLRIGYQKVPFIHEDNIPCFELKTVERSPMTNFFTNGLEHYSVASWGNCIGLGGRHTGLYWTGSLTDALEGFDYGVAVVNSQKDVDYNYVVGSWNSPNQLGYYANISYTDSCDQLDFLLGCNFGYQPAGTYYRYPPGGGTGGNNTALMGCNPYLEVEYQGFSLMAEAAIGRIAHGKLSVEGNSWPIGVNIMPAYKFNDEWELVFRYSYLDTNSRGVSVGSIILDATEIPVHVASGSPTLFNQLHAYYIGFNWYIVGNSVKLTAGYEYTVLEKRCAAPSSSSYDFSDSNDAAIHAVRARMQILF